MTNTVQAQELSWTEFQERIRLDGTIIIPAGMTEQHGRHNPLGTDSLIAEYLARHIAEKAEAIAAPVFPFGYGPEGLDYPGQISLPPQLLRKIWYGYGANYAKHGAKRFLFVNGHGGNGAVLRMVASDLYRDFNSICVIADWWTTVPKLALELTCADHGGLYETSVMMAVDSSLVDISAMQSPAPDKQLAPGLTQGLLTRYNGLPIFAPMDDYRDRQPGNLGLSPQGASAELGRKVIDAFVDFCVGLVRELRTIQPGW
ncbi:amidase [Clostridia bacterium]|nr:amidase [Clostridia bacterium]